MSEKIIFSDNVKSGEERLQELLNKKVSVFSDLLKNSGIVNLDKWDIISFLDDGEYFMSGTGQGEGKNRAVAAAQDALQSLGDFEKNELTEFLLNITTDKDATLKEINDVENFFKKFAEDFLIPTPVGHVIDDKLCGEFKVVLIAKFEPLESYFSRMFYILPSEELILKINSGFNPNQRDKHGCSFIEAAIKYGTPELLTACIKHGGDVNIRHEKREHSRYADATPLIILTKNFVRTNEHDERLKAIEMLKILIEAGADVNATDHWERPALEYLLRMRNGIDEKKDFFIFLKILLNAGASFNALEHGEIFDEAYYADYESIKKELQTLSKDEILKISALVKFNWFVSTAIREYDIEAIKMLIEKLDGDLRCFKQEILENIKSCVMHKLKRNFFPDSEDFPPEYQKHLSTGSEILSLLEKAGIEFPVESLRDFSYFVSDKHGRTKFIPNDDFSTLVHVLSPGALRHFLKRDILNINAEGRDEENYKTDTALSYIVDNYEDYLKPEKMVEILIDAGADVLPLKDTWVRYFSEPYFCHGRMTGLKILAVLIKKGKLNEIVAFNDEKCYFASDAHQCNGESVIANHMLETFKEIFYSTVSKQDDSNNDFGMNLIAASICGTEEELVKIIRQGWLHDVNISTFLGYTPLMFASVFNTADVVKCLIKFGADVNARTFQNQTALTLAVLAENCNERIFETLVKFGADVNEVFGEGSNLLMLACEKDCRAVILSELIKAGADVNFKRKDGKDALTIAIEKGNFNNACTLLAAGADVKPLMDLLDTVEV